MPCLTHSSMFTTYLFAIIKVMKRSLGFTVVELLVVVLILAGASVLFYMQRNTVLEARQDTQRKTAINAMYYNLEEVFYKQNNFYPETISSSVLTAMDPELFKDPDGRALGEQDSDYRYEATDCDAGKCKGYSLRTTLMNEADFVRTNRAQSS